MTSRRVSAGLLAAGGVVAGHMLTYSLAVPDPHERLELLVRTGHGYWSNAVVVALAAVVGAIALWIVQGLPDRLWSGAPRLMTLQCGGFLALELLESLISGGHLADRPLSLFAVGLLCQVVVASASALVIGLARAVADRSLPARSRSHAHPTWTAPIDPAPFVLRAEVAFSPIVARGPPLAV